MQSSPPEPGPSEGWSGYLKALGPGLLWAGAAIGVSHLVQSTRAGAEYGFSLVWMILLCLALKYPLFEYGHRYTAATGENLVQGYRRLGKLDLWIFLVLCIVSGFIALSAVTFFTGALVANLLPIFPPDLEAAHWSAILLVFCLFILVMGRFAWLDGLVKLVILVLTVSTVVAAAAAFYNGPAGDPNAPIPPLATTTFLVFLVALLGWMPAPIEFAAISSLWINQRAAVTRHRITLSEALFDFRVGYLTTAVLSVFFVSLGALVMFGTGEAFSNRATAFSAQLIDLYTKTIGDWAAPVINIAAVAAMFSTTITVMDGYPRAIDATLAELWPGYRQKFRPKAALSAWLIVAAVVAAAIIYFFRGQFVLLITIATCLGFLAGPIFGWINLRLVSSSFMPPEHRPGKLLVAMSWAGIVLLTVVGLAYVFELAGAI
ncbi:MAG: Nramp family divalent metal transporter [Verrucomicrobiota bacterium]